MMQASLWTSMFMELGPLGAVKHIAELGWRAAELSDEHLTALCEHPDPEEAAGQFREAADQANLFVRQAHLFLQADVVNLDETKRRADLATIKAQLDFCQLVGINVGVIHPGPLEYSGRSTSYWRQVNNLRLESFRELADYAGERGVRLALENMTDRPGVGLGPRRHFGAELWELLDLIEAVGSSAMGICLDTSHANVQGYDQPSAIRELGELLIALHISDNDGTWDLHWIPLRGTIDWPPIVTALKEINFGAEFNLEIPGARRCPAEFWDERARHALAVAQILLSE